MTTNELPYPTRERLLNPFAFPPETNVRFALLIVAVAVLSLDLFIQLGTNKPELLPDILDIGKIVPTLPDSGDTSATLNDYVMIYVESLERGAAILLVVALVLIAAWLVYRSHPARLRRTQQLTDFPPDKDIRFTTEFADLAGLAGIKPVPAIQVGAKLPPADGQVFGFKGRYIMRLGTRMPLLMRKAPATFRAIILHELAHISNGDIGRAYFSQSLWTIVIVLLLAPLALLYIEIISENIIGKISALVDGRDVSFIEFVTIALPTFVWLMIQLAGLLALFPALRGSLLRAREVYADWRAALWGAGDGLETILQENSAASRGSLWSRLWRFHPEPRQRLAALHNPRWLFTIPYDVPFLVGCLGGAALSGLLNAGWLIAIFTENIGTLLFAAGVIYLDAAFFDGLRIMFELATGVLPTFGVIGPMLVVPYLVAGTVGLQAQRDAVAAAASGEKRGIGPYLRLIVPAALLAIGLQIGFLISPGSIFSPVVNLIAFDGHLLSLIAILMKAGAWMVGVIALLWLALAWTRFAARRLMTRKTGLKAPNMRRRLVTLWLMVVLWALLIPALLLQTLVWYEVNPVNLGLQPGVIVLVTLTGLFVACGMMGFGAIIASLGGSGTVKCPTCGQPSGQRQAVGQVCQQCGGELAEWLVART